MAKLKYMPDDALFFIGDELLLKGEKASDEDFYTLFFEIGCKTAEIVRYYYESIENFDDSYGYRLTGLDSRDKVVDFIEKEYGRKFLMTNCEVDIFSNDQGALE